MARISFNLDIQVRECYESLFEMILETLDICQHALYIKYADGWHSKKKWEIILLCKELCTFVNMHNVYHGILVCTFHIWYHIVYISSALLCICHVWLEYLTRVKYVCPLWISISLKFGVHESTCSRALGYTLINPISGLGRDIHIEWNQRKLKKKKF